MYESGNIEIVGNLTDNEQWHDDVISIEIDMGEMDVLVSVMQEELNSR